MSVPVAVRCVTNCYTPFTFNFTLQWDGTSPQNCCFPGGSRPPPSTGSLGQPESITKTASWSPQPFLYSWLYSLPILDNGTGHVPPKLPLLLGVLGPSKNTWFLRPTRDHYPNGISIGSAVFVWLTLMSNRQSHRARYIDSNRPQLMQCSLKSLKQLEAYTCSCAEEDYEIRWSTWSTTGMRKRTDGNGCTSVSNETHRFHSTIQILYLQWPCSGWRGTVVERRSLAGELSLSCARPAADGWPLMSVNHPLQVSQLGQLSLSSFLGR